MKVIEIASALVMIGLVAWFGYRYVQRIKTDAKFSPVWASWIILSLAVFLSFYTYWQTEEKSLIGNIGNAIDLVLVVAILRACWRHRYKVRLGFNLFELFCLTGIGLIVCYWFFTSHHVVSNLLLQSIMVIGFLPMYYGLYYAETHSEPKKDWWIMWTACLVGLAPPILHVNFLGIVYMGRALTLVTILLVLIYRVENRAKHKRAST